MGSINKAKRLISIDGAITFKDLANEIANVESNNKFCCYSFKPADFINKTNIFKEKLIESDYNVLMDDLIDDLIDYLVKFAFKYKKEIDILQNIENKFSYADIKNVEMKFNRDFFYFYEKLTISPEERRRSMEYAARSRRAGITSHY